jgi:inner membrane protein
VLPFLLTGAMMLFDRLARRMGRATLPSAVAPGQVLLLAGISVFTHPVLDSLNTYGVRWLMPFSQRWFYGDTLFIVDPWLWVVLATGFALSGARRRSGRRGWRLPRPARAALMISSGYIAAMALLGLMTRRLAARELTALTGERVEALMAGPAPLTPVNRDVVAAQGGLYRVAEFRWLRQPHIDPASVRSYSRGRPTEPAVATASETELGRRFLSWARFPIIETERMPGGATLVHMIDLRYARRPGAGFGTVTIQVPPTTASRSASRSPPPFPPGASGAPAP